MTSEVDLVVTYVPEDLAAAAGPDAERIETDARSYLEHLERCWSRFLPDSDVTRVNLATGDPVLVDAATVTLFTTMLDAWHRTGGRYDPTVLPALVAAGYGASKEDPRRMTRLPAGAISGGCMDDVRIDAAASSIAAPAQVAVDPGGIGKGLAADLTAARLLHGGAAGAMVSIGGDLVMVGTPPDPSGWRVAIEHPDRTRGLVGTLAVSGGGVATSSTRSRRWIAGGHERHHVIDPATNEPADTDLASVTVFARTGWLAEAHATAALLSGRAGVLDELAVHGLTGVAVDLDGNVITSPDVDPAWLAPAGGAR
jgi:thiamine biosynthesis lipoprotein